MKRKEKPEMKIEYVYVEPKTKEEAERRLISDYDILFNETERRMVVENTKNQE